MYPTDESKTTPVEVNHGHSLAAYDQALARPTRCRRPAPIGYGRAQLDPADLRRAVAELGALGVHSENIYIDQGSTGPLTSLQLAMQALPAGGTLIVSRLARLARSLAHLAQLVDQLDRIQVGVQVAGDQLDQLVPAELLRHLAQLEVDLIDAGVADAEWHAAHSTRDQRGAKAVLRPVEVLQLRQLFDAGMPRRDLGQLFELSEASVFRIVGRPVT